MADAFADSDVLIDAMRGLPQALAWFASLTNLPLLPGLVYLEIIGGARDKAEQRQTLLFLSNFKRVWPTDSEMEAAGGFFVLHHLPSNLGIMDAMIAATVIGRGGTLYTFNKKHFGKISGLTIEQPYTR